MKIVLNPWLIVFIVFCTAAAIQVFYYVWFFARLAFYRKPQRQRLLQHPVSVVICARDEAENLAQNLPAVLTQTYKTSYEVVAVDDNSFDDTKYVLEALAKPYKHLRNIELKQEARLIQGKKFPLSVGIKEARYEILLLTDADCQPASPLWIEKMQEGYHNDDIEIVLGYGAYEKKPGLLNKLIRFETFLSALQYLSFALAGNPYMGVGRNLSYKKSLFLRNKGFAMFNQIPGGDDDLFINRVANKRNTAVVIDADAFTYSTPKTGWRAWRQQKARHYTTGKYYKLQDKFLLFLLAFSHFLFYPLLILSLLFYDVGFSLGIYGFRLVLQGLIFYRAMDKLKEKDLFWMYPLLDIWQWFYYLLFADTLWKKAGNNWK